jgi:hypothetical protein
VRETPITPERLMALMLAHDDAFPHAGGPP